MQADLDKIPDKLKPASAPTPPPEVDGSSSAFDARDASPKTDPSMSNHSEPPTPPVDALSKLTVFDSSHLDSDDDSESGCPITIEVVESDSEDTAPTAKVPDISEKKASPSPLGPAMKFAQVTKHGEGFCPILPIAKYPYKYVPKAHSQAVASAFFDNGQFWQRDWDL